MSSTLAALFAGSLLLLAGVAPAHAVGTTLVIGFEGLATTYDPGPGGEFPPYVVDDLPVHGEIVLTFAEGFDATPPFTASGGGGGAFEDFALAVVTLTFDDPFLDGLFGTWEDCIAAVACGLSFASSTDFAFEGLRDPDDFLIEFTPGSGIARWSRSLEGIVYAEGASLSGTVTSALAVVVPEPSTGLLLAAGLVVAAFSRRRG